MAQDTQTKNLIVVLMVGCAALGALPGAVAADQAAAATAPGVVLTGADSRIAERGYYRIAALNDWVKLWQRHKGQNPAEPYDLYHDPLGLPVVDFDRYLVIAIFQGKGWNSAGLKAVCVSEEPERLVLRFDDKSYQTAGPAPDGGGKPVTVYGFFVVPRSAKPVVVEEDVQRLLGQPPEWQERITFPKL